ncbi:MAG TPA: hypothetical protein VMT34_12535 [Aggregatilineales bacterium]|nr:hypothetical protein [Aggregatilineales bacterium]
MKTTRYLLAALCVAAVALLAVPSAQAAALTTTPRTVTITEDQINSSYRITNPVRRSVTNAHVTLGDGIVTISATITHRDGTSYQAQSVWKPYISARGALIFGFQSATVNGQPATRADRSALIIAHRYIVRDAIRDYIRRQVGGPCQYVNLTVTPGLVTINVNVYTRLTPAPTGSSAQ